MEEEIWRDVVGYEGLYQVSSNGRVKSLSNNRHKQAITLTPQSNKGSIPSVSLRRMGEQRRIHVDVIVASAFIGKQEDGMYVGHVDGDEFNNRASNLVWVTEDEYIALNKRAMAIKDEFSNTGEIWSDIPGYGGAYQASSLGRIRTVSRIIHDSAGKVTKRKGKIVTPVNHRNGYVEVRVNVNGKCLPRKVHRLVAEAFIPNPDGLPEVDHIDMNRANNRVENLQWITHRDNCRRSIRAGTYSDNFSKMSHPDRASKSKWAFGRPIMRDDGVVYTSISEATRANGCKDRCSIKNVLVGRTKTCNGHSFSYI